MDSFLMIGQSNMAGRGFLSDVEPIYDEKIKMLRNGRWQMMVEPINVDREVAGVGPAASFAVMWRTYFSTQEIGLIPCAEGGSELDEWLPTGTLFKHAVMEAKFAMKTSHLAGILWHQGESDSLNGKYVHYAEKLQEIFDQLRIELADPNLPIMIGGLGDYLGQTGFGQSATEFTLINEKLQQVANQVPYCYFVTAKGLTANPDGIHISAYSQRIFGIRYFMAFQNRTSILTPLPDEEDQVVGLTKRKPTANESMYLLTLAFSRGEITYDEFIAQAMAVK